MIDFTFGQWVMIWFIGAFCAHMTTAWKDGMEGCLGIVIYGIFSIIGLFVLSLFQLFIRLGG